jgi:drug/metabolite transporter (DMT)-like permease
MASASIRETLRVAGQDVAAVPAMLDLPSPTDLTLIAVGVLAVSTSGPLIAATAAPALAIAFWRNGFATVALAPLVLVRHRAELVALRRREWSLAIAAGLLLAAHFATWVLSLRLTSVASATALVTTQPIWVALLARRTGASVPARVWVGIVVAVVGAGVLTGADLSISTRALGGDVLAIVGGAAAAGYMVAGSEVRRHVSTVTYTAVCYATTAVALLLCCVAARQSLGGYSADTWLRLVALTVGAQFLGHSLFNRVLRTTSPTVVSLAILLEVPGASLLAAVFLGQRPSWFAVPGLMILLAGIGVVITARDRATEPSLPAE